MAASSSSIAQQYQQPIWGQMDRTLRNCLTASGILALVVLIVVLVAPVLPPKPMTVDDVPERIARLILEKPAPVSPSIPIPKPAQVTEIPEVKAPPKPKAPPRRTSKPKVARSQGVEGRQRAQKEVTQNLAQVTGSLDKVLDNLSKSLPATESADKKDGKKSTRHRRRSVRSGRSSGDLASVTDNAKLSSADVSSSAIETKGISISAISDLTVQESSSSDIDPGTSGGSAQSGRNELRSNEDLLATVRRYAPGIQFCYDNELKKNPNLRGKLVVSVTVLANGRVSEAFVVEDGLQSPAVVNCVLSQIRGWQLPAIPHGVVSFKTPFVFTPPN